MSNLETLDVGQANELKLAFRRTGWTNEDIKRLCEGNTLSDLRKVQLGLSEIKPIVRTIDCDADPFVPNGWRVEEHQRGGIFIWDPDKVKLYLSKKQKGDNKYIVGNDLRKELKSQSVLNANVLDYLLKLENQHLIPEDWKGEYIFFWGTIYRSSNGDLFVRYLCWDGGRWDWVYYWLDGSWGSVSPAAVLAS